MSLINKEILPFTAQAFDPKKDQFKEVTQEDLKGSWSVVCFYPADFSFVCPTELEDLQNQYEELQKLGVMYSQYQLILTSYTKHGMTIQMQLAKSLTL